MKPIFSIKNLICSYDKEGKIPILFVPDLEIPQGEICALFGKSGSGKSTLLETLGLMTDSIAKTSEPYKTVGKNEGIIFRDEDEVYIKFHPPLEHGEDKTIPYIDLRYGKLCELAQKDGKAKAIIKREGLTIWNSQNDQQQLRHGHFSFIFQNFNLMPNFTAIENVAIPEMIKNEDSGEENAIRNARKTLEDIDIPTTDTEKKPSLLSGGQKQRVAFARAKNAKFSILFGDEPTGNLDQSNSERLMKVIRDIIDLDEKGEKTSIIVTHDINLTLRFADRIVPIKTVKYGNAVDNRIYGKIDSNDVYKSKLVDGQRLWFDSKGSQIPENQMKIILFELLKREL